MTIKKYTLKFSTSNLANLLFIKGLFLSISPNKTSGGVMLPKKKKRFTLVRSPHVNKKSKEHFKFIKYRRLYIVFFTEEQLYGFLEKVPNDVEVTVKCKN